MSHRSKTRADAPRTRAPMPTTVTEYAAARRRANNPLGITEDMRTVLGMLRAGWTLHSSTTMSAGASAWMSKRGQPPRPVKRATVDAVQRRRLLDYQYAYPTATYTLTAFGKIVADDGGVAPRASR